MKNKLMNIFSILTITFFLTGCNNEPKASNDDDSDGYTKIKNEKTNKQTLDKKDPVVSNKLHRVVIKDILPATRYLYLLVQENNDEFWIAVRKMEINIGETYFYYGGLLKTNFKSNEYDKVFDKIYLVTSLVKSDHGNHINEKKLDIKDIKIAKTKSIPEIKGSIKISELVRNQKELEGKTVQISGICSKTNPNIMGRNWIHVKDGSLDDYDLVITSSTYVKEGTQITIKGVVALNKDFGAGYMYKLILENGVVVP